MRAMDGAGPDGARDSWRTGRCADPCGVPAHHLPPAPWTTRYASSPQSLGQPVDRRLRRRGLPTPPTAPASAMSDKEVEGLRP